MIFFKTERYIVLFLNDKELANIPIFFRTSRITGTTFYRVDTIFCKVKKVYGSIFLF